MESTLGCLLVLPLDRPLLDEIAIGGAGVGVLGILTAISAHLRVGRLRRGFAAMDGRGKETVLDAVRRSGQETTAMRGDLEALRSDLAATRGDVTDALRHVAVVRYDAFGDMGGRLSFTVALLDDAADGVVLSSIHGRSESRSYAKGVKAGASEQSLSPEEQQAIELAMRGSSKR
jgi:hypothetical protein